MSEIFTALLEKANEEKFITYLISLNPADKKQLIPHVKKLNKEYTEYGEVSKSSWGFLKGTDKQRDLLQLASFVLLSLADYQKTRIPVSILQPKELDKILYWYVPDWFSQFINSLVRNEWIPDYVNYNSVMDLADKGILQPSNELLARLIPNMVFERKKDNTWLFLPEKLYTRPVTLQEHIWYVFDNDTGIHHANRYLHFENGQFRDSTGWIEVFKKIDAEGKIDRQRLLKESLLASNKNFNKTLSGFFAELFSELTPSKEELLGLQKELFSTLSATNSKPVNTALDAIKKIMTEPSFETSAFLDASPLLIASSTKAVVNSTLSILEKLVKKSPSHSNTIAALACAAFIHQDDSLQTRAAKLIMTCQKQNSVDVGHELVPYQPTMMAGAKKILEELFTSSPEDESASPVADIPEEAGAQKQLVAIPAIESIDDLVFLASQAMDNNQVWHVSVLPALLIQWQEEIRSENIAKFEPALQRALKMAEGGQNAQQGMLDHMLAVFFIDVSIHWVRTFPVAAKVLNDLFETFKEVEADKIKKHTAIAPDQCYLDLWKKHYKLSFYTPYRHLLITALEKIKKNDTLPLLSSPTHEPCWIDPLELTKRIIIYSENNKVPDDNDLQIAVSRCYLYNTEKAIELVKEKLNGEFRKLLLFLFDVDKEPQAPFYFSGAWLAASFSKKQKLRYPAFEAANFYFHPFDYYTGQRKWESVEEDDQYHQYDYRQQKQVLVKFRRKKMKLWLERPVEKPSAIKKLLSFISPQKIAEPDFASIYTDLKLKTEFLWVEHNDIERIILLIPNNPEPLLADTLIQCFEYPTFISESHKQFVTAVLKILYELWDGYGEMANVFLGTCMLSSDKTVTNLAAEIWINAVTVNKIDSAAIGEVIGRHESIEFAPLKRFTDLASQKLFRISAKHNHSLLEMIENIIKNLSLQPITNLKKLLDIYYELLNLDKSAITDPSILEKLQAWQNTASVQKIAASLLLMREKNS